MYRVTMVVLLLHFTLAKKYKVAPIAIFGGLGDRSDLFGMKRYARFFSKWLETKVKPFSLNSNKCSYVFKSMEAQWKLALEKLNEDPDFQDEFLIIGNSQGGIIARYIIQNNHLLKGRVRNLVTLGTPHMGGSKMPYWISGFLDKTVNSIIKIGVYWKSIQKFIGLSNLFRNPKNLNKFNVRAQFLNSLNNQVEFDPRIKENYMRLNKVFLGMFKKDRMLYPKESALFGEEQPNGDVLPLTETKLYKNDIIGLKHLNEQGKLILHQFDHEHMQFSYFDLRRHVIPVLKA